MRLTLQERERTLSLGFDWSSCDQSLAPPRKRSVLNHVTPDFDVSLLQMSLFGTGGQPEAAVADSDFGTLDVQAYVPDLEDCSEPLEWSEEGIRQLHSVLLHESIKALAGRGNGNQKREILQWIFRPEVERWVDERGNVRLVRTGDMPWTFSFCCRLENMTNPDIIRDFIARALPQGCASFI